MTNRMRSITVAVLLVAFPGLVEAATLRVKNNTACMITVHVDNVYGCSTAAFTYCEIPVTVGVHRLRADCVTFGGRIEDDFTIPAEGFIWEIG